MKVYVALRPGLDEIAAVWAVRTFVTVETVAINRRHADWRGQGMKDGDIAIGLEADGRGMTCGHTTSGTIGCFAQLIESYAPENDRMALGPLVAYLNACASESGSAIEVLAPGVPPAARDVLGATGLDAVLSASRRVHHDENRVIELIAWILTGMLQIGRERDNSGGAAGIS